VRVLIATPEYPPHAGGGILKYYRALAPVLARQGCDVTVLVSAPTTPDFADYTDEAVRVMCVRRRDSEARADELAQFSAAPDFRRWLGGALAAGDAAERLGPWDVIETVDFGLTFVPFVAAVHAAPVLVQMHGSLGQIADREPARPDRLLDNTIARLAEATLLPFASAHQTYATDNAREWEQRIGRPVTVCPPPMRALGPAGPSSTDGGILVVGRIQTWKGPAVLCEALRHLPGTFPLVTWLGRDTATAPEGGSLSDHLAAVYPDVWSPRITALGQQPFEAVQTRIAAARVVVVPSDWDVFNFGAAEAMSMKRVVVCSSGAGVSDLITHGRNGFVFRAGDAESLAAALEAAVALPDDARAAMGREARDTIVTRLDPDIVAGERLAQYQALVAGGAPARVGPADWLREMFTSGGPQRVGPEFLDQMNVRDLSTYLGRRLRSRLIGRLGEGAGR